jgi:hypothetical protein
MNGVRQMNAEAVSHGSASTEKARLILISAHESAQAFLQAFDDVRQARGDLKSTTEAEQDLLRAMLVFAAAGLDSTVKQLIRDVLPTLVEIDDRVRQGLETFVSRQIRGDNDGGVNPTAHKFLARLLAAESHQKQVIKEYIGDLTGKSMQSAEELMRAAYALGIEPGDYDIQPTKLRPIFDMRNMIIHELDIDFKSPPSHRQMRSRNEMLDKANILLEVGEAMLNGVTKKLALLQ